MINLFKVSDRAALFRAQYLYAIADLPSSSVC